LKHQTLKSNVLQQSSTTTIATNKKLQTIIIIIFIAKKIKSFCLVAKNFSLSTKLCPVGN
jgi:hypothetical protein